MLGSCVALTVFFNIVLNRAHEVFSVQFPPLTGSLPSLPLSLLMSGRVTKTKL